MRFFHLSDLHLGKRVCECSMLEDQRYILEQILPCWMQTRGRVDPGGRFGTISPYPRRGGAAAGLVPHGTFRAGRAGVCHCGNTIPPTKWPSARTCWGEPRLCCGPVFEGRRAPIPLQDEYGPVDVYLLPF